MHLSAVGPWAQPHAAVGLLGDLSHDAVAMQVFAGQGQQDLEGSRGKRDEFSLGHKHSIINISIIDYTLVACDWQEWSFGGLACDVSPRINHS